MKTYLSSLSACLVAATAFAQPAITVYNENFGVVRDTVPLELQAGMNTASYSGVTSQLEPESVVLRDPAGNVALSVIEQSYRGDPVDQQRLLQMFEGETIQFLRTVDHQEFIESGKIIRAPRMVTGKDQYGNPSRRMLEPIIEIDGMLRTSLPGQPLFPSLGDDSVLQPTLSWKLHADQDAAFDAQLSYLTYGMSWKADYNLVLPETGDSITLTGWVSIQNQTGKTFEDARIKLIAGDVNKVQEDKQMMRRERGDMVMAAMAAPPQVEEKKFDEFHMYTLPLATTLRDQETKQVEFVRAENVQTTRLYVYDGANLPGGWRHWGGANTNQSYGQNTQPNVAIYRELENTEANGLGVPLPAGRTRFYRMDDDGQLEFTGENTIRHTPRNETIRVYLGNAFDLVGERKRTDFYTHPSQKMIRETFEIEIRNRGDEPVTVRVVEHMFRWSNWDITRASAEPEKKDAQTIEFPVSVGPDSIETVTYTVEYRW